MATDAAVLALPVRGSDPPGASALARRRRARRRWGKVGTYVLLGLCSLLVLFPLYVLVVDSLLQPAQLAANPPVLFPSHPAGSNYTSAWTTYHAGLYLRNSAIQTSIIVAAQLVTSVLAAYALVFVRFPLRRTVFVLLLTTVMIPFEITVAVNSTTVRDFGWQGNFLGLTCPFFATGFGIFLMRQAFLSIPKELREAAAMDGYGPLRFLWGIAIPLARPVIAALAVFSFLGAWNQYLWPALIADINPGIETIQIGLRTMSGASDTYGIALAGGVMSLVPLLILLVFFRKNLIRSLTAGAVK